MCICEGQTRLNNGMQLRRENVTSGANDMVKTQVKSGRIDDKGQQHTASINMEHTEKNRALPEAIKLVQLAVGRHVCDKVIHLVIVSGCDLVFNNERLGAAERMEGVETTMQGIHKPECRGRQVDMDRKVSEIDEHTHACIWPRRSKCERREGERRRTQTSDPVCINGSR